MSKRKGLHCFDAGELVLPHPSITMESTVGIVIKVYRRKKQSDSETVLIFWQHNSEVGRYFNEDLYHLHHESIWQSVCDEWKNISNNKPTYKTSSLPLLR